jgi:hypothetical protein
MAAEVASVGRYCAVLTKPMSNTESTHAFLAGIKNVASSSGKTCVAGGGGKAEGEKLCDSSLNHMPGFWH